MSGYDQAVEVSRRTMVLFFMVDTSGSMNGDKIGSVNQAIREVLPEIQDISNSNADAQIKIAVLDYSTSANWLFSEPLAVEDFNWKDMDAHGMTVFGEACEKLEAALHKESFMGEAAGSLAPAIFLLSDGVPTDTATWRGSLEKLQKNKWFKVSMKVAIAIGESADKKMLAEFTGTDEAVLVTHDPDTLTDYIKMVSVRASQIGSQSSSVGSGSNDSDVSAKQADIISDLKNDDSIVTAADPADIDQSGWEF